MEHATEIAIIVVAAVLIIANIGLAVLLRYGRRFIDATNRMMWNAADPDEIERQRREYLTPKEN